MELSIPKAFRKLDQNKIRNQYAALCYRVVNGKVQVLLVTSRGTGRWIVPKGWPMAKKSPHEAALIEAEEEAGVVGKVKDKPLGLYTYYKQMDDGRSVPCVGTLFPVKVKRLLSDYPEVGQRNRKWFSRKKAAKRVAEPDLAHLIRDFDPSKLG